MCIYQFWKRYLDISQKMMLRKFELQTICRYVDLRMKWKSLLHWIG